MPSPSPTPEDHHSLLVDDAHLCPICHLLLYRPVTTSCAHSLCASCMLHWATASRSTSSSSSSPMTLLPITHPTPIAPRSAMPPPARAVSTRRTRAQAKGEEARLRASCPLCRAQTSAAPDARLEGVLQREYADLYASRAAEEDETTGPLAGGGGEALALATEVFVGNTHAVADVPDEEGSGERRMRDWTLFVRPSHPHLVAKVVVHLHPSFATKTVVLRRAPYGVERCGWGTFVVRVDLYLKRGFGWVDDEGRVEAGKPLSLEWGLTFEGEGGMGKVRADVKAL